MIYHTPYIGKSTYSAYFVYSTGVGNNKRSGSCDSPVQGCGTGTGENAVHVSKLNKTTYADVVKQVDSKLSANRNKILARAHSLERILSF